MGLKWNSRWRCSYYKVHLREITCKLHASLGIYWKYHNLNCVIRINKNSLKTGKYHCKVSNTGKGLHISNTANRYLHSETNVTSGKLLFPLPSYLQAPHTTPTHFCKKPGRFYSLCQKGQQSRESWPNTYPAYVPFCFGQQPTLQLD